MKILIVGCGKAGSKLAINLSQAGNDIIIIDSNPNAFKRLGSTFNGLTVQGSGTDHKLLGENTEKVDTVYAFTDKDNVNIATGQLCRDVFKIPRVIVKINNNSLEKMFKREDIQVINMTTLSVKAAMEIINCKPSPTTGTGGIGELIASQGPNKKNGEKIITIIGGGESSLYLCRRLVNLGHIVSVIEKDQDVAKSLSENVEGLNVITGNGCDESTLKKVSLDSNDIFVALTGDDTDNLIACQMAKKMGAEKTIAKMNDPHNELMFLGKVDKVIDEITTLTEKILSEAEVEALKVIQHLAGQIDIVNITAEEKSKAIGKTIAEIFINDLRDCNVGTILRNMKAVPISGDVTVKANDQLIVFATSKHKKALQQFFQ